MYSKKYLKFTVILTLPERNKEEGREGKGREGKGREGKGWDGKGREDIMFIYLFIN